ncbi:MAG: hypothetical protein GF317_24310 [Candidatus Lokiarchaeota archaeon]|nr:hypothetical protein [Candidatus Lokiarchaeota archaeon]MBD3202498.1 hypothetical protein [Candidatus Lokiarchaeota archaeon]
MELQGLPESGTDSLTYTIQNIVVKSNLGEKVNLDKIHKSLESVNYNSNTFPGLFLRYEDPKCVIIMFQSGKFILTGLLKFEFISVVLQKLVEKLNKRKICSKVINSQEIPTEIVNIVVTANYFKRIDLNLAALRLQNAMYEPEIFPGIIYKVFNDVSSVYLIFSTGKVVLTGIKEKSLIEKLLINLGKVLKKFNLFLD